MIITIFYLSCVIYFAVNNKNTSVINTLLMLTLFVLFAFEHSDQDYLAYSQSYYEFGIGRNLLSGYEPAYLMFCLLGNKYNLSFDCARGIICIFEVLAIYTTAKVFTRSIAFVLALFLIYPGIQDAELFRWLAALSTIIFAMPYVIRGKSYRDYCVFLAFVVLATTIHTSSLFFMIYTLLAVKNKKKVYSIMIILFLLLLVSFRLSLFSRFLSMLHISTSLIEKYEGMSGLNIFGVISMMLKNSIIFYLGYVAVRRYKAVSSNIVIDNNAAKSHIRDKKGGVYMGHLLCEKLMPINALSTLLFVLGLNFPHAQRLFDVLLFINISAIAFLSDYTGWRRGKRLAFFSIIMLLLINIFNGSQNMDIFLSHFREGFLVNLFSSLGF